MSTLEGLPEYGVTLSGTPENPIIENNSGRAVIGYRLMRAAQNGHGPAPLTLLAFSGQPTGIPDGGAVYAKGNVPVNLSGQLQALGMSYSPLLADPVQSLGLGPIVSASLRCVLFSDGQFVGMEEEWVFEQFGRLIKVMAEVGLLAKAGAWDQLEALDFSSGSRVGPRTSGGDPSTYFERRIAAGFLVRERKWKGDSGAMQLAETYTSQPTLWKQ
jgi:hypothetical protein